MLGLGTIFVNAVQSVRSVTRQSQNFEFRKNFLLTILVLPKLSEPIQLNKLLRDETD